MTHPGSDNPPSGQQPGQPPFPPAQPGQPAAAWTPPQGGGATPPGQPEEKSGGKKWLAIGGAVLAVGVVGISALGLLGAGDPEVGDCVRMVDATDFEAVDCGADDAEFKITGIDEQEMTETEFQEASVEDVCVDFETTEVVLWIGDMVTEPGTIYCATAA